MKNLITLLVLVSLFSCKEEPFSPTAISTAVTEGWPYQQIKLSFENEEYASFKVRFGNLQLKSVAIQDGLEVTLPFVSNEEIAQLIVETPGGEVIVVPSFKLKSKPKVVYSSSNSFADRVPLKIVLSDWSYYSSSLSDYSQVVFDGQLFNQTVESKFLNDTLSIRRLSDGLKGAYQLSLNGPLSFSFDEDVEFSVLTTTPLGSFTYKSSFSRLSTQGKVGEILEIIFNDTFYSFKDITVKLSNSSSSEAPLKLIEWTILGTIPGYKYAYIGRYEIPMLPAGNYSLIVTDPLGVTFLAEDKGHFTITQ